jgi:lactate 2-monooxygenase
MLLGWRPHDLDHHYLPFGHGVGVQVGTSDPVFMKQQQLSPRTNDIPEFPYDPKKADKLVDEGNESAVLNMKLGRAWLMEANSGTQT